MSNDIFSSIMTVASGVSGLERSVTGQSIFSETVIDMATKLVNPLLQNSENSQQNVGSTDSTVDGQKNNPVPNMGDARDRLSEIDANKDGFLTVKEMKDAAKKDGFVGLKWKWGFIPFADQKLSREEFDDFAAKHGLPPNSFDTVAAYDGDARTVSKKDLKKLVEAQGDIIPNSDGKEKGLSIEKLLLAQGITSAAKTIVNTANTAAQTVADAVTGNQSGKVDDTQKTSAEVIAWLKPLDTNNDGYVEEKDVMKNQAAVDAVLSGGGMDKTEFTALGLPADQFTKISGGDELITIADLQAYVAKHGKDGRIKVA
ncbi:MAG: hypothetical protein V4691_05460 [Pseudomonadota bacterium]